VPAKTEEDEDRRCEQLVEDRGRENAGFHEDHWRGGAHEVDEEPENGAPTRYRLVAGSFGCSREKPCKNESSDYCDRFEHFAPPSNGSGVQLRQTAPTVNAGAGTPAARMLPRIDWSALFGVSCNGLLDGTREGATGAEESPKQKLEM